MAIKNRIQRLEQAVKPARKYRLLVFWQGLERPEAYYRRPYYGPDQGEPLSAAEVKRLGEDAESTLLVEYVKDWRGQEGGEAWPA